MPILKIRLVRARWPELLIGNNSVTSWIKKSLCIRKKQLDKSLLLMVVGIMNKINKCKKYKNIKSLYSYYIKKQ